MIETLKALVQLQSIDSIIHQHNQRRAQLYQPLDELRAKLGVIETELAAKRADLTGGEEQQATLEKQTADEREKARAWEKRLRDIKHPRDYAAMQREVEGQKRTISGLEDESLRLMEGNGLLRESVEQLAVQCKQLSDECAALQAQVAGEEKSINEDVAKQRAEREAVLKKVPRDWQSRYNLVLQRRQYQAVVAVLEGRCGGCNMQVPHQQFNTILRGATIEVCRSCNRVLYIPEQLTDGKPAAGQPGGEALTVT